MNAHDGARTTHAVTAQAKPRERAAGVSANDVEGRKRSRPLSPVLALPVGGDGYLVGRDRSGQHVREAPDC